MTCNRMLKEPTKMASNKTLHNPWNCTLLIFDIPRLLIYVSMIQLHLSSANCTTQLSSSNKQTFYLVHGVGHGAWCWFKLVPLLEAAGHKVTTIDLSASGINTKHLQDLRSFNDYSAPLLDLMDSLPLDEKVVLVGHSFGGMSISLAMDMYPNKISVAIFVSAFLPDTTHVPSYVLATFLLQLNTTETLIDTQLYLVDRPNQTPLEAILFGPDALKYSIYHLSPPEDLELAKLLVRESSLFVDDLSIANKLSEEGFGSVKKVYIKNEQDKTISGDFQRWMIENEGLEEVKDINNADHMSMISRPQALCKLLLEVAQELS